MSSNVLKEHNKELAIEGGNFVSSYTVRPCRSTGARETVNQNSIDYEQLEFDFIKLMIAPSQQDNATSIQLQRSLINQVAREVVL